MITFIHTADIHFGMENYGKLDTQTGIHSRLLDFEKALNICIDRAIAENVDFFLFSGDAYKTINPSPTQQKLFMQCFFRLYEKNIPIVIIVGNHDNPLSFGKANSLDVFGTLPLNGFYVVSRATSFVLQTKSGPVQIVGVPWPTRNMLSLSEQNLVKSSGEITQYISQAVARIIKEFAEKLDPNIPAVLASHITVSNGIFSGSEKRAIYGTDPILMPSELAIAPFDYVALGHLHRYQNLNPGGYPAVVYSGSIERIDFGERKEEKGFCLVTIEQKGTTRHEFIEVPTRPFLQIEAYLTTESEHTKELIAAIGKHNITDAVIKILYHIPAQQKDMVDLQAVERSCAPAMHVVGIIPVRKPVEREQRAAVNVAMDLETLLTNYFDAKTIDSEKKRNLINLALELQQEINESEME